MFRLSKYELRKNRTALFVLLAGLAALQICFLIALRGETLDYAIIWSTILVLYAVVCYFAVFIFAITNYYREINSKTSYLVFMTPVSALSIILSKMLTVLVLGVILAAALGALGWLDFSLFLNQYSVYKSMGEVISEVMKNFGIDTAQVASMALFGIITFLLSVFSTVAMLYLCITLAATLLQNSRLKLVVTIALFVAGIYAESKIQGVITDLHPMVYRDTVDLIYLLQQSWPYALANLAELALFMILTTWLLEKKLSL